MLGKGCTSLNCKELVAGGRRLSVGQNLLASGMAVVAATALTHPIDVVKVQLQFLGASPPVGRLRLRMTEKSCARADSFSLARFLAFWRKFQAREGTRALSLARANGPNGWWPRFSGLQAASVRAATYGSARIGLCQPLQERAGRSTGAVMAGVLATVVGNPFEVLKVRLQARPTQTSELQLLRDMAGTVLSHVRRWQVRVEGLRVLGSGFGWAATRSALLTVSQVVPYATWDRRQVVDMGLEGLFSRRSSSHVDLRPMRRRRWLVWASQKDAEPQNSGALVSGGAQHVASSLLAGLVTTTVTAPVDVLKTKVGGSKGIGHPHMEGHDPGRLGPLGHAAEARAFRALQGADAIVKSVLGVVTS